MDASEVASQIRHMVAFLQQEGAEKCEEIRLRAEKEAAEEKGRRKAEGEKDLNFELERKRKFLHTKRQIEESQEKKAARIRVLSSRDEMIQNLKTEVRQRLALISKDEGRYKLLLRDLIVEAALKLREKEAFVVCRDSDKKLVEAVLADAASSYENRSGGEKCSFALSKNSLSSSSSGGVVVETAGSFIRCSNTLDERLELIFESGLPRIRQSLFG